MEHPLHCILEQFLLRAPAHPYFHIPSMLQNLKPIHCIRLRPVSSSYAFSMLPWNTSMRSSSAPETTILLICPPYTRYSLSENVPCICFITSPPYLAILPIPLVISHCSLNVFL